MQEFKLLRLHMGCQDPQFLVSHAKVVGLLALKDEEVDTYEKYRKFCADHGITSYPKELYDMLQRDFRGFKPTHVLRRGYGDMSAGTYVEVGPQGGFDPVWVLDKAGNRQMIPWYDTDVLESILPNSISNP